MLRPIKLQFADNMRRLLVSWSIMSKDFYVSRLADETTELLALLDIQDGSEEHFETLSELKKTNVMFIEHDESRRKILLDQVVRLGKTPGSMIRNLKRNRYFREALKDWIDCGEANYA